MLRKVIKYQNAFGEEKEKVALFSLSQEDLIRLNKKYKNELDGSAVVPEDATDFTVEDLVSSIDVVKDFIMFAYYETDAEGELFDRSQEAKDRFINSFAGVALIDELITDENAAKEFMSGVVSHIKNDKLQEAMRTSGFIS